MPLISFNAGSRLTILSNLRFPVSTHKLSSLTLPLNRLSLYSISLLLPNKILSWSSLLILILLFSINHFKVIVNHFLHFVTFYENLPIQNQYIVIPFLLQAFPKAFLFLSFCYLHLKYQLIYMQIKV